MQRMHLTWLGALGDEVTGRKAFKVVVTIFLAYTVFQYCLGLLVQQGGEFGEYAYYIEYGVEFIFIAWSIYVLMKTRKDVKICVAVLSVPAVQLLRWPVTQVNTKSIMPL